jgi:surface protein
VPQPTPLVANPHASRPGAFPEGGSLYTTQTSTNHTPANPVPVPSTQSRLEEGITLSEEREHMVEATLVSDLVVAEIVEEEFWRQRKVQRCAFLLFLATAGLAIGVGVALSGGDGESVTLVAFSASPSASAIPSATPSEVPSATPSAVPSAVPPAVPSAAPSFYTRDTQDKCISFFDTTSELRDAVDEYLLDNSTGSEVAIIYGHPIGNWCVSKIQDFGYLFNSFNFFLGLRFNPAAVDFNEDISRWDVSNAKTFRFMFHEATSFDQPLGNWDVSSVTEMSAMFLGAESFNKPVGDWDVSSVTDMLLMFHEATSFDQPLGNWDVSSVTDMMSMFRDASSFNKPIGDWDVSSVTYMSEMFESAASFNQSLADWNVQSNTDIRLIFRDSGCPFSEDLSRLSCGS